MDGNKELCPVPMAHPLHIHFLFQSTSFEDEEELPLVIGAKIIKAGPSCRIICHFIFYKVAAMQFIHPVGGKDCLKNVLMVFKCSVHSNTYSKLSK